MVQEKMQESTMPIINMAAAAALMCITHSSKPQLACFDSSVTATSTVVGSSVVGVVVGVDGVAVV